MKPALIHILCLLALILPGQLLAQTTQPSDPAAALELRAAQAFANDEYALALPMLEQLAEDLKDQPERRAPVLEKIRVCQRSLESEDPQAEAILRPADPPPSAEQRKHHATPQEGELRMLTIKDLGNFEYDAESGGNIPPDVQQLSGMRVQVSGFMIPMDQADKITQFALVPDLFACCFGQPPQIQHTVVVNCPEGKAVGYFPDEIVVEGKLSVEEKKDEGFIVSLFEIEAASVRPAAK